MSFEFGSGFQMGGGFALKAQPANPLDTVGYTDDLEVDSLAELDALLAGMCDAPAEADLVLVFPERGALESFMWRRHLDKSERFVDGPKGARCLGTPQRAGQFKAGGGFSVKQRGKDAPDADDGWVKRAKDEKSRFKLATDPEYYCVLTFSSAEALEEALASLGLGGVDRLPVGGVVALPGPVVDSLLL